MRVHLDACITIYSVEGVATHRAEIRAATNAAGVRTVISDLVRMECMVWPIKAGRLDLQEIYLQLFNDIPCIGYEPATFDHAAQIRATHNLRTPDALHIAAATAAACDEFWTNDQSISAKDLPIRVRLFPAT